MNKVVIAGLAVVLIIGILLVLQAPEEPVVKNFEIDYSGLKANKIVEISENRKETIFLPKAEGFGLITVIPKKLASNVSEINITSNGKKEIWKNDPIIQFQSDSGTLKVEIEYPNNLDIASINLLLPN